MTTLSAIFVITLSDIIGACIFGLLILGAATYLAVVSVRQWWRKREQRKAGR